jgi:hypothetical protein
MMDRYMTHYKFIPLMACALLFACTTSEGKPPPTASVPSVAAPVPATTSISADTLQRFDGLYVGTAVSMRQSASNNCRPELTLKNFKVQSGQVSFGGFRGPIEHDGSIEIWSGSVSLTGRFEGTEFRGEFRQYPSSNGLGGRRNASLGNACLYVTALQRHPS